MSYTLPNREEFYISLEKYKGIISVSNNGSLFYTHTHEIIGIPIWDFKTPIETIIEIQNIKSEYKLVKCKSMQSKVTVPVSKTTMLWLGSYNMGCKLFYPDMPILLPMDTPYLSMAFHIKLEDGKYKTGNGVRSFTFEIRNNLFVGESIEYLNNRKVLSRIYKDGFMVKCEKYSTEDQRVINLTEYEGRNKVFTTRMVSADSISKTILDIYNNGKKYVTNSGVTGEFTVKNGLYNGKMIVIKKITPDIRNHFDINNRPLNMIIKGDINRKKHQLSPKTILEDNYIGQMTIEAGNKLVIDFNYDHRHKLHGIQKEYFYTEIKEVILKDNNYIIDENIVTYWYWHGEPITKNQYIKKINERIKVLSTLINVKDLVNIVMSY